MKKLFRNGRYANVAASLALFVALGGTSYAAITLPRNSVSTKQIKNHAVTLSKISVGARATLKGQTGPRGPAGPTGPAGPSSGPGTTLWATVNYRGVLSRGSHAVDSVNLTTAPSTYRVMFDRDVSGCAYSATLGGDAGGGTEQTLPGEVSAAKRDGFPDTVTVNTYNSGGVNQQLPFFLVVHC